MITLLKIARGLYRAIAGSGRPWHLALGLSLGILLALVPLGLTEPMVWLVVGLLLVTRAGFGIALSAFALGKLVVALTGTGWIESVGFVLLERSEALQGLWRWALNLPVVALFGLDRYQAMGGLVLAVLLSAIAWVPFIRFVYWVRARELERYRLVRWLRSFWFVRALGMLSRGS
ncbi:MAG: hypothetical protein KatS3mg102_0654 [Planctomycetota bacterium]|nr:MAG: hypothetical protein KatS3mg102_0654 [Planctomycetota bacterium]